MLIHSSLLLYSAVINGLINSMSLDMNDMVGTELKTAVVNYENTPVSFQYQMWHVVPKSVCADLQQNVTSYSACTQKAKQMFNQACNDYGKKDITDWRQRKTKNMVCDAAVSYQPMIASISATPQHSKAEQDERECNLLTLKTMSNDDPALEAKRKKACHE